MHLFNCNKYDFPFRSFTQLSRDVTIHVYMPNRPRA